MKMTKIDTLSEYMRGYDQGRKDMLKAIANTYQEGSRERNMAESILENLQKIEDEKGN
jgi:hypothetical protein